MANANQVIINGETILDLRSDTVTPETLQKGYTAHDKSGTKITGTLEASSSGAAKETWVIKSSASGELVTTQISFTSNGQKFTSIGANSNSGLVMILYYDSTEIAGYDPGTEQQYSFDDDAYRKLTFDAPPTGDLLTWLQANGVKQPDDTAVQDTKALTITSNGTVSITPDAPYDAVAQVYVTVDVASGGGGAGFSVTFPATATNWGAVSSGGIVQADGTVVDMLDYTKLSGKTFSNVVAIKCTGGNFNTLRMVLLSGKIATIFDNRDTVKAHLTVDGETTYTTIGNGYSMVWIPLADTVISSIEMYNTD